MFPGWLASLIHLGQPPRPAITLRITHDGAATIRMVADIRILGESPVRGDQLRYRFATEAKRDLAIDIMRLNYGWTSVTPG